MKSRIKVAILSGLIPAGFLTGCGASRVEIVKPPSEWMVCKAEPMAPLITEADVEGDDKLAAFLIDLRESGADCRTKVLAIKEFFDRQ